MCLERRHGLIFVSSFCLNTGAQGGVALGAQVNHQHCPLSFLKQATGTESSFPPGQPAASACSLRLHLPHEERRGGDETPCPNQLGVVLFSWAWEIEIGPEKNPPCHWKKVTDPGCL
jgi:hypothetical protein